MNRQYAIYTAETSCIDCYRCVRSCPVKAIRVENGRAAIVPDLCVACGTCVDACPNGAKIVRRDLGRAKNLLAHKKQVYISLAPSYASEFAGTTDAQLIAAFKQLGFAGVSETALGADMVSQAVAEQLRLSDRKLHISTACPAAVDYIRKYLPALVPDLTELFSPMLAHARLLKKQYGDDCGIVFVGPCIAKKCEADLHPDLIDVALTFTELHQWLEEEDISLKNDGDPEGFVPHPSVNGAIYPVAGGMIDSLKPYGLTGVQQVTVAGLDTIRRTLDGMQSEQLATPIFMELLACQGGCTAGPCAGDTHPALLNDHVVRCKAGEMRPVDPLNLPDISNKYRVCDLHCTVPKTEELAKALLRVGKHNHDDELNCGGCGYNSCRSFAQAMIDGRAEPNMCLSFLRQRAQKKANALLRCMPSGVVIVDNKLKVIECNLNFAQIAGEDAMLAYDAQPGLEGADLKKLIPFHDLFYQVLRTNEEYHSKMQRIGDRLLHVTIFSIEPFQTVGGIALDVTHSEMRREHIVKRAREVIDKNMTTVQEIACMLGEHMADTEILLRSIAEDFGEDEQHG
jgi:iron only hydrogenase large subunit-like protein